MGFSSDLARICTQSKVGAVIYAERVPISAAAEKAKEPLSAALMTARILSCFLQYRRDNTKS